MVQITQHSLISIHIHNRFCIKSFQFFFYDLIKIKSNYLLHKVKKQKKKIKRIVLIFIFLILKIMKYKINEYYICKEKLRKNIKKTTS